MKRKRDLPMTWVFARTSAGRSYTFRWGRGAGFFTVHAGDRRGVHDDEHLLDTVHIGRDWDDDEDVRAVARQWLDRNDAVRSPQRVPRAERGDGVDHTR